MSLDFSPRGQARHRGRSPRSVAAATFRPAGRRRSAIGRWRRCRSRAQRGIAFVDLPATLVWFDEAGRHQESLDSERPVGEQLLTHFYRCGDQPGSRTRATWKTPIGRFAWSRPPGAATKKAAGSSCDGYAALARTVSIPSNRAVER